MTPSLTQPSDHWSLQATSKWISTSSKLEHDITVSCASLYLRRSTPFRGLSFVARNVEISKAHEKHMKPNKRSSKNEGHDTMPVRECKERLTDVEG